MRSIGKLAVTMVLACAPSSIDAPQRGSTSSASSQSSETSGSNGPGDGTMTPMEACAASPDPSLACPVGCATAFPHLLPYDADVCAPPLTPLVSCVPAGEIYNGPPTTFYALESDTLQMLEIGGDCGHSQVPAERWTDCASEYAPDACACFCVRGYCVGDDHRRALDGCGLADHCGVIYVDPYDGADDPTVEDCTLAALRDRERGVYEVVLEKGYETETVRLYVFADGAVMRLDAYESGFKCPATSPWGTASSCTLQPPEYFEACMGAAPGEDCVLTAGDWVIDCVATSPSCG